MKIPCAIYRGGTSKPVFFLEDDLPKEPVEPVTKVRIYNTNTKKVILAEFEVKEGEFVSEGSFRIDGAPGSGSKILLDFIGSAVR
jgi:2-methylaconitate cis-trans-isomerase PrpF